MVGDGGFDCPFDEPTPPLLYFGINGLSNPNDPSQTAEAEVMLIYLRYNQTNRCIGYVDLPCTCPKKTSWFISVLLPPYLLAF